MLNILIACDHKPSREALHHILSAQHQFYVIAVCADTHAAIAIAGREQPDIVLLDGSSDPLAAIEATKKIVACSTANVIAFSRRPDSAFATHMLAAGALGYLTNESCHAEIIIAVQEVAKDNLYYGRESKTLPVSTPERISAFKKSIGFIRKNSGKKIVEAAEWHWHSILRFAN